MGISETRTTSSIFNIFIFYIYDKQAVNTKVVDSFVTLY